MNTNQEWIKMSERKPTVTEFPIWASTKAGNVVLYDKDESYFILDCPEFASHWRPAAADIPAPPKEETQVNKDTKAYVEKYGCASPSMVLKGATCYTSDIWHAALAYERAEVAKLLPDDSDHFSAQYYRGVIETIRARCGGANQ